MYISVPHEDMARLLEETLERIRERTKEKENAATAGGEAQYSRKEFRRQINELLDGKARGETTHLYMRTLLSHIRDMAFTPSFQF